MANFKTASHPYATLATQARPSGENLNYLLSHYSDILSMIIGLSGLNCDSVALEAGDKSVEGEALGTVIINLQQTEKDGLATLRIFSPIDHVFKLLLEKLHLEVEEKILWKEPSVTKVIVPYNRNGVKSDRLRMVLDLAPGTPVRLNPSHNCQGSRQPSLLHVYGNTAQEFQVVCRPPGPGRGSVKAWIVDTGSLIHFSEQNKIFKNQLHSVVHSLGF